MKVIKFWAPDGKKYEAATEAEANEFCTKMHKAMKLAESGGGQNSTAEIDFEKLTKLVDSMVAEKMAKLAASKSKKNKTKA